MGSYVYRVPATKMIDVDVNGSTIRVAVGKYAYKPYSNHRHNPRHWAMNDARVMQGWNGKEWPGKMVVGSDDLNGCVVYGNVPFAPTFIDDYLFRSDHTMIALGLLKKVGKKWTLVQEMIRDGRRLWVENGTYHEANVTVDG